MLLRKLPGWSIFREQNRIREFPACIAGYSISGCVSQRASVIQIFTSSVLQKSVIRLFALLVVFLPTYLHAQLSFTVPGASDVTAPYCEDYFRDAWNTPLNMDSSANGVLNDINLQTVQVDGLNYANGVLNFNTTGTSSYLTLLSYTVIGSLPIGTRYGQNFPVQSSKYRLLSFRMYSNDETIGRIRWFHDHSRWALTTFTVFRGWHTYEIDLGTAPISLSSGVNVGYLEGNPQGLELFPSNENAVQIGIDWIQLTPLAASCPTTPVSFDATAMGSSNRFSVIVDTDTDPSNGIVTEVAQGAAAGAASVALGTDSLFPSSYRVYGLLGSDWAGMRKRDSWDMSNSEDLNTSSYFQIAGPAFSGGRFTGTTTGTDPSFFLNFGSGGTIDASVYSFFSIGIDYTLSSDDTFQIFFFNAAGTALLGSKAVTVQNGSNLIQFQLTGGDGWAGEIGSIRIDPVNRNGVPFSLDFFAIRSSGYVASLTDPAKTIATGALNINDLTLGVSQPDKAGGRDFAQTTLGNSWNMNALGDVSPLFNVLSASFFPHNTIFDEVGGANTGDFFYATNIPGNGDSNYLSVFYNANINPAEFVNVCFRGWNETESPSGFNSVARILWQDPREAPADVSFKNGDDIIMNKGVNTYCVDMATEIELEPALPPGSPNPWTSIGAAGQSVSFFRVDMNENEEGASVAYYSVLDYITVRTDHESNSQYAIVVAAPLSQTVKIFSNSTRSTTGGVEIGTLSAGRSTNVFKWDTSNTAEGAYYIYATATASGNTLARLAPGRIQVNHGRAQDSVAPILECERPFENQVFDAELELAGYALDDTRLATLEVTINGTYQSGFLPSQFHLAARDAYPNYAESNSPGFQRFISTAGLANGTHTFRMIATDTAGNETVCQRSIIKQNGGSTPPLAYPAPAGAPISVPIVQPTPTPAPGLSIAVSKKTTVTMTVTGTENCSSVQIFGSRASDLSSPAVVFNGTGTGTITRVALKTPGFKPPPKPKKRGKKKAKTPEDGSLYFKVQCDTVYSSAVRTLNAKSIKNNSKSTEAKILNHLVKRSK